MMPKTESNREPAQLRVAILGGGISGLAAALRLEELRPDIAVELFEATGRMGGILETVHDRGYLVEQAADNFLRGPSAPWAEQLSQRWGVAEQLIPTDETHRGAHVGWRGELHPVPAGFQLMAPSQFRSILQSKLLSPWGKLRLCLEPLIREPQPAQEETLRQFATRRLGHEAFERLVEPLVAGIYTADPDRLSIEAALPQMVRMARESGSLYRAMRQRLKTQSSQAGQDRGARYSLFVAPRDGMSAWIDSLVRCLKRTTIHLKSPVSSIQQTASFKWQLDFSTAWSDDSTHHPPHDAVIVALPGRSAASVLRPAMPKLATTIDQLRFASSAVVCFGFCEDQIRRPLNAFGCVIPASERRQILAISYSSVKFPGRAPQGCRLLRVFLGGAMHPETAQLPDNHLIRIARDELNYWLHVAGEPHATWVVRWLDAMPQYELGHAQHIAELDRNLASSSHLALAGNYLHGVGVPQCVRSGEMAAERILQGLTPALVPSTNDGRAE